MSDLYWVKFPIEAGVVGCASEGGFGYGVLVPDYDRKKYKVAKGYVPVEDAIFPVYHQVKKKDLRGCSFEEYSKFVEGKLKRAVEASRSLPKKQVVPGKLFRINVGDGFAWYIVTKVDHGKKTCDVEHRGFSLDEWYDHYFGSGRKNVLLSDVKHHVLAFE